MLRLGDDAASAAFSQSVLKNKQKVWPPGSGTALGQDGSDRSRDLVTLTFDPGGHDACG